ncbi:MAG: class I SAM-dependent methyltransferase [Planctomycetes bacterium]|nr:class I SAM-dependent methyltransferase [Planctomycetota bacterium]
MDYSGVTEVPGNLITREGLRMMQARYGFAAEFCAGKDVLELGCGAGMGLGCLARRARRVVGGDYTSALLRKARRHYGPAAPLVRLDAQSLPFRGGSFDVAVLYEAIYYLERPEAALGECRRVLRPGGVLILCSVNREWPDFNPSPFSRRYLSASELSDLLEASGFEPEVYGAFRVGPSSAGKAVVSFIKRSAVLLGLMPRTMRGKQVLKRVFLGRLVPVPAEIPEAQGARPELEPLAAREAVAGHKVLYAVGRLAS